MGARGRDFETRVANSGQRSRRGRELPVARWLGKLVWLDGRAHVDLARVLAGTGLDPALLELEITGSLEMADPAATAGALDGLRELGVRQALDDFGTGYSSLACPQRLPLHTFNIHRAFVEHMAERHEDLVLTGTIVPMAHALGLRVIAEGVETEPQLEILRQRGCDQIQGYLLSPPLCGGGFDRWLRRHRQPQPA